MIGLCVPGVAVAMTRGSIEARPLKGTVETKKKEKKPCEIDKVGG